CGLSRGRRLRRQANRGGCARHEDGCVKKMSHDEHSRAFANGRTREFWWCKVWAKELPMKVRFALLAGLAALSAVVSLGAQSKAKSYTAKTAWGDPDLQGVWDYKTITPLERPAAMGDRQFLNDEEVARLEGNAAKRLD